MAKSPISRYMDTIGDGTGTKNAALLNGSVTPVILKLKPGAGEIFRVSRLIIATVIDANNPNSGYAGSANPLPNGFTLKVVTGVGGANTLVWDICDGIPIVNNHDWKNLCHDEIASVYGTSQSDLSYRYTFINDGTPIILEGDNGDELQVTINDDLTLAALNLTEQLFRVGFKIF